MNKFAKAALSGAFLMGGAVSAYAGCGVERGRVNIIGNEFPAIQTVANGAASCAGDGVEVKANLTADHQKLNVAGMSGNPAEYTSAIVANSSIVELINQDVIRPLDDLVAAHGSDIPKHRLITIDGKVMAVAFMANAQHLVYRKDILDKAGVQPPKTYEELLDAAKKIKDAGLVQYPVTGTYKAGWNLAEEFVNMYIGHGGEFFKPGTAEVSINNEQGVATLNMMKALSEFMNPDFLTYDSNAAAAEWEAGNAALMNMWGSRMGPLTDNEGASEDIARNTIAGGPMTVAGGTTPATTLWWDGWTVAKNVSDEDAQATFVALKTGSSPAILNDESMPLAVWMIEGYKPSPTADGVAAAISAGSVPYPMQPFMGLLHTAVGDNISDFLQGKESAEQALADAEAAYTTAAKEKGFLK